MAEDPPAQITDEQSAPEPKGSMAADFSLLLGILSNLCFWFVAGIPAIILGIIAIRNINRNPTTVTGRGRARTGIITGCTGMVVCPFLYFLTTGNYHPHNHPDTDTAKCILQMSTLEKLVISHGNINDIQAGQSIPMSALIDEGYLKELYTCPAGGMYTYAEEMPTNEDGSKPYTMCSVVNHNFDPWGYEEIDDPIVKMPILKEEPITEAEVTVMKLENTILAEYSVIDLSLGEALAILQRESEKYGKLIGYKPVKFYVDDSNSKKKVTLVTKNNSIKIICESISQQVNLPIKYTESKVIFRESDTD